MATRAPERLALVPHALLVETLALVEAVQEALWVEWGEDLSDGGYTDWDGLLRRLTSLETVLRLLLGRLDVPPDPPPAA